MSADDDVTRLALAAGRGDRASLSEFIRRTQDDVWRFIAHAAGVDRADDLTQETFLRSLTALPTFEGRSSARTWLLAIARRVVVDLHRHEDARPWLRAVPLTADREWRAWLPEETVGADQLLARLTPDRRQALVLTRLMGFTYDEAAEICGCPVGTIRSRVARARADLVSELQDADAQPVG